MVDIILVFWVEAHAGLGYMKEETQPSSLYLVSAVGPSLSALTFSIPTLTGYTSVKNESSSAFDLLENMDTYIFNAELLQCSAPTGLFKYRSLSGFANSLTPQHLNTSLASDWMKVNQRLTQYLDLWDRQRTAQLHHNSVNICKEHWSKQQSKHSLQNTPENKLHSSRGRKRIQEWCKAPFCEVHGTVKAPAARKRTPEYMDKKYNVYLL